MLGCIVCGFQTGRPLKQLEHECRAYGAQMVEFKRFFALGHLTAYWLTFARLLGSEKVVDPLFKTNASIDLDTFAEGLGDNVPSQVSCLKSRLCAIFGDHVAGQRLRSIGGTPLRNKCLRKFTLVILLSCPNNTTSNPINLSISRYRYLSIMPETFARALSLYACAIETKHAKYRRHARRPHVAIKKWRKNGNPNVIHFEKLLDAEAATLKGQYYSAESLYQSSTTLASRSGLVQDAALALERYANMLLLRESRADAVEKLHESLELYREWGATAKVKQLRAKCSALIEQDRRPSSVRFED